MGSLACGSFAHGLEGGANWVVVNPVKIQSQFLNIKYYGSLKTGYYWSVNQGQTLQQSDKLFLQDTVFSAMFRSGLPFDLLLGLCKPIPPVS